MGAWLSSRALPDTQHLYNGRTPGVRLNIVIVGCGLGGLACGYSLQRAGHKVVILEAARTIGEVLEHAIRCILTKCVFGVRSGQEYKSARTCPAFSSSGG
jgi:cation diffusion facilitator CzcD-associated flavoprotein CzcO